MPGRAASAAEVAHLMAALDEARAPSHLVARTAFLVATTPGKAARHLERLRNATGDTVDTVAGERAALEVALAAVDRCQRCGAALSDPVSVRRGVGPECVKHGR